jgi:alanine dehydrogenase
MKLGSELLWLSEKDVASLLTMEETLPVVENAFRLHGLGEAQLPSKIYLTFEPFDGDLRAMPAYLKGDVSAAGVKIVNSNPSNPAKNLPAVTGILVFTDPETGLPLGVFGAGTLTAMRTGAAGGIAVKYLARKNSSIVGLVGCGRQAQTQLEALLPFFKIKKVLVWGKTTEESDAFCKANKNLGIEVVGLPSVESVCQSDIIVTTTPVKLPVVKAAWIKPGTHINAIGADAPGKQELETALIKKARVVVDDWHQASHAGEVNVAVSAGALSEKDVAGQLGEIIVGKKKGRQSENDITVFDSTGLAIQDIATAKLLFQKAGKLKKGQVLQIYG